MEAIHEDLDTVYTDASCYESLLSFPTNVKLLWECVERAYKTMCGISSQLGEHRLKTKYNDIEKANLAYRKQRKHTHKQTRKMIMRLLALLGKILGEIRRQMRVHPDEELLNAKQLDILRLSQGYIVSRRTISRAVTLARVSRTEL